MFRKTARCPLIFTLTVLIFFLAVQTVTPQTKDAPPQSNSPASPGKAGASIELLTDPEGVDFNNCIRQVYFAVRGSWFSNMPPSVEKGNQGRNAVQFRIMRDGTVPKDSLELMYHSGKDELDMASLRAVREAAPFKPLPEKFSQPSILLRITFYYNLKPPTP